MEKMKGKITFSLIMLCVFITLFIFAGTKVITYIFDEIKNKQIESEISEAIITINDEDKNENPEERDNLYEIDFENLKQKNPDTVGFIKVNGTNVEHIIVQTDDNDYYLRHNFNKEYNSAGWIFADYRNKLDETDKNIIIYGHNMRNDTMFGTLKNILTDEWYNNEENKYITFITENESSIYEVFSVYQIESEDKYLTTSFKKGEFEKFANTLKKRSKYEFNVNLNDDDQILTLSTCANNSKYRIVLHARKKGTG